MKIERINDNQVRFTLNKTDLIKRQIKISELAYGSEKAQELFKDMMSKAFDEFGFEVHNTPLMIEAVPLSKESIMIIVTKVDEPDQLEEKLVDLSSNKNLKKLKKKPTTDENIQTKSSIKKEKVYVFQFNKFDHLFNAAEVIPSSLMLKNRLYKDDQRNKYYILMKYTKLTEKIKYVKKILSEYSQSIETIDLFEGYLNEHCEIIIKTRALQKLKNIG